jgi:transcriptional regulator with GAF, ATPase, and Fis domain
MNNNTSINQVPAPDIYREKEGVELILSSLNTGLAIINPDMTVAWANEVTLSILPWDELIGKVCYVAAAKRDKPCEGCGALMAFADGQIHETERQSPVDHRWHFIVSIPIKDEAGNVISVLESVTDITKRKNIEIERDTALKELEELKNKLEEENLYLKEEVREASLFSEMVGTSNALRYVQTKVAQVAPTRATVLIQGETGVGKELVARAIHANSNRSGKPFISINCAALPSNLVESELFGHERGAFTGAEQLRKGRFELADGGTLFLDEISELPPASQAKLLGVLQDGEYERVGSSQTLKSDARIIAATNRDLNKEIEKGHFRPDLYYRLNVYPITVPPLCKRKEDIPLLINHFVNLYNKKFGRNIVEVAASTMDKLQRYHWPGNVRELRNIIERAMITSLGSKLVVTENLEPESSTPDPVAMTSEQDDRRLLPLEEIERRHILSALEVTGWRVGGRNGAASILKMHPSTLRSRMKKVGLEKPRN